jgi:surface antigen
MLAAILLVAAPMAAALNQSVPGLVARQETASLSFEDRIAAFDAEQAVLSQDYGLTGYQWEGPDGAYGTIISGNSLPHDGGRRHCRRFIHIVHHKDDRGANPTFQGVVCRSEGGQWEPQ